MNNATNVAFDIPDVPTRVSDAADTRISPMLLQIASMGHVSLTMGTVGRPRFCTNHRPSLKERADGFVLRASHQFDPQTPLHGTPWHIPAPWPQIPPCVRLQVAS